MATLKVKLLTHKKRADGKCPLAIRMTHNRKSKFSYIGYYILEKDWNAVTCQVKKSYPNSTRLNNVIRKKLDELEESLMDSELKKREVDLTELKAKIGKGKNQNHFFAVAANYLQEVESSGKFNQFKVHQPRIKQFQAFLKNEEMPFEEITPSLIRKYKIHLQTVRKFKESTVMNHLALIRLIFNRGIAEGIVEQQYYPFGKGKVTIRLPESQKIGLNEEEVTRLENLKLEKDSSLWHTQNIWLFSFYLAGMRISDVLKMKWTEIQDGRLNYRMSKNGKVISIKLPDKAQKILSYYKLSQQHSSDFIFNPLKNVDIKNDKEVQRVLTNAATKLNKKLKELAKLAEIDKKLTNHVARHTFGNISRDRIPIKVLQQLYRHSSVTTTIGYQNNFITDEADKALEMVVKL